ncbi:TPA: hypothetical protein LVL13_001308 [Klebsiella oxytoca]|nr:hypothetical protein [Klebsiella oxytoca]
MIDERLTHEELKSLSLAMKSHFEVMAESGSEAEIIECSQIVRALKELNERRHTMDGEPVVFTDEPNLHHIAMGRETSLIWGKQNSEAGDIPLYRHAQQPVVPDALADTFIAAIEKEQDRLHEEDYLMDSKDCIDVIREEVQRLNANRTTTLAASPQEVK